MITNTYDSVLEKWEVRLIKSRAKKLGFFDHEIDDALQEVVIALLTWPEPWAELPEEQRQDLLPAISDNLLRKTMRSEGRRRKRETAIAIPEDATYSDEAMLREVDITAALDTLEEPERQICKMLAAGHSVSDIAQKLDSSWFVVNGIVNRVRQTFEKAGLEQWFED